MTDTATQRTLTQSLADLASLEAETARLEAASAVKRLQRAFGYYLDAAQWDEAAQLFADDATIEMALDGVYCGRDRIRAYLHALGGGRAGLRTGEIHEWFQLQPVVHVAADALSAKARWRTFLLAGQLGEGAFWGEGPYEVEYVRRDGVWRIARLHWYQTMLVPYEGGWLKNRDATGGILASRALPPDRPPSEPYETWPGVYTPPFHYESPVTAFAGTSAAGAPGRALARALEGLERRVRRLHAIAQIENLIGAYGYYLDKQRWDDFAALFAEDATLEISQRGVYAGRASIRRALELFGPEGVEPHHLHNHQQLQPLIHVSSDGRRAWARSRAFGQLGVYQGGGIWHGAVYENEFVLERGLWRFKSDHAYTTYFAHYDRGWMSGARPTAKVSEKIPPDRPPSVAYESFPEIYIPPFHYAHPVTGQPVRIPGTPDLPAPESPAYAEPLGSQEAHAAGENAARGGSYDARPGAAEGPAELRAVSERIASVLRRLERLEDEQAIETLQRSYGYFVDKALWSEAADLFADGGTLEIGGRGVFAGRGRVLEYLKWLAPHGLTRGKLFDHMQLQPIVTLGEDGRTARGRWRFFAQVGEHERSGVWGLGTYENEYVKERGVWRIAALHSFFRMYTPYADGWGKTALPSTRPERSLPPDRPPTVSYEQYPSPYIPACHYAHPVKGARSR